ncbi:MAG: Gfo/Idh/MocA family oxidoreductase [Kiritimatiellaeota bacterium]|nr:Gfo/Idh/MocA family oxidoreductase [Kiritimatiellota bacterium]
MKRVTRRTFLEISAATGAAAMTGLAQTGITPSRAPRLRKAGEKLNMAFIGSGGRGSDNLNEFHALEENIVALCDIDRGRLNGSVNKVKERCPEVRAYQDWREMLAKEKDLDAVVVSTPDHMHAACAIAAMKQGCHVYVEKPLVRTVWECRRFGEVAKACGVFTQMGNNGNGTDGQRRNIEILQSGILGEVSDIFISTDRPIWPQGLDRPEGEDPLPEGLNWDGFIGVAPVRPFKKDVYHPFKWRGWFDFGTGAMGDIACHGMSFFFRGLDLREVLTAQTIKSTPKFRETYPAATTVKVVAKRAGQDKPVTIYWHDGDTRPDPDMLPAKVKANFGDKVGGTVIVGNAAMFANGAVSLADEEKFRGIAQHAATKDLPQTLPRVKNHHWDFAEAIRGGARPLSDYDHSVPLTELVLLGCISQQIDGELKWDAKAGRFTNSDAANNLLKPLVRSGWEI